MACIQEETIENWISDIDWNWLEHNLGGWNIGEQTQALKQRLGPKVCEGHRCSA